MTLISNLIDSLDRQTAGSEETAQKVLELCGSISPKNALFIGDELFTPTLLQKKLGVNIAACFTEKSRAERAAARGFSARVVMPFEIPRNESGWDFVWYNGITAIEGSTRLLESLGESLKKGGRAVFRTLCWLIDPSPDTKCYIERRFGRPEALDAVVRNAKELGFKIHDFYIAPKTDWTHGLYEPLKGAMARLSGESEDGEETGISELNKEMYMFELHSEEYSFVYYILEK